MIELTDLERTVLEALAAGPRSPAQIELDSDTPAIVSALARLEEIGATRMSGSSDAGPWSLTPRGYTLLSAITRFRRP